MLVFYSSKSSVGRGHDKEQRCSNCDSEHKEPLFGEGKNQDWDKEEKHVTWGELT